MASDPQATPDEVASAAAGKKRNPDWHPWVPLLIVPVVLPLITTIYNRVDPKLWGIPAFYWVQMLYVFLSAVCTAIVYAASRPRGR